MDNTKQDIINSINIQNEMVNRGFESREPDDIIQSDYWELGSIKIVKGEDGVFKDHVTGIKILTTEDVSSLIKLINK